MAKGANVNFQSSRNGWTPLMIAVAENHPSTVSLLLDAGADAHAMNKYGRTALMFSAKYGYIEIVNSLLKHGAHENVIPADESGATALIAASAEGHYDVLKVLLENTADTTIIDKKGKTAIMWAEKHKFANIVQLLKKPVKT